jgi:class 3 adenylate cyclase/tetratricopeptide (TPR) repeat protein
MTGVATWLAELGLGDYAPLFAEHAIDSDVLPELTEVDLEKLDIPLGHRKRLLRAIAEVLAAPAAAPSVPAAVRGAERRQLTVMFVDLVGSTELSRRLDPEDMQGLVRAYQNAVAGEVARFEGHIAKFMGDGVLAYFGWPRAHEDDAERAVRAGLGVVAAVGRVTVPGADTLAARVGIATGPVVVGELTGTAEAQERAVVGETPNLASRLQVLAEPGSVVIARSTSRLVAGLFELAALGLHDLKGFDEPVAALAVEGERATRSRFEARSGPRLLPMVGREQDLALLLERWRQAREGEGQGVLLIGEAGIGKSRISRALLDAVAGEPHRRIHYQCSPYHTDSALWPVIQQLSHAAGLVAADPPDTKLDKLAALLAEASADIRATAPLIASLLGLDGTSRYGTLELTPQVRRTRTLDALTRLLLGWAARQPVLVVLEDAHWIDPTTLELIEQCLQRIAAAPVLVLITSRPDDQPGLPFHPHITRLALNRLGRAGVEAIVARLGGDRLPSATVGTIVARADGVPLYVEELTKAVLETDESVIPASLQDSLMARLDRSPEIKEVAQVASCIGREFDHGLLAAIVDREDSDLRGALDQLIAAEPVFRQGAPPEALYIFKHALVQDAAYQSLLKTRRRTLHGRIAEQLESSEGVDPSMLAWHCAAAGLAEKAATYYLLAGQHLLAASALPEAGGALELGLEQVAMTSPSPSRDRLELDLRMTLATARMARLGWPHPSVSEALEPAYVLARALGDRDALGPILWGLWVHYQTRADFPRALELLERLDDAAASAPSSDLPAIRDTSSGCQYFWQAEYDRAAGYTASLRQSYDRSRHGGIVRYANHDPLCFSLHWAGSLLDWILGYPERALASLEEALTIARQLNHPFNIAFALTAGSQALLLRGDHERMLAHCEEVERIAAAEGLGLFTEKVLIGQWRGKALVLQGAHTAGYDLMAAGNDYWNQGGGRVCNALFWSWMALGLGGAGRRSEALDRIELALVHCRETGDRWMEPEALRIQAGLLLDGGAAEIDAAEQGLCQSIRLARAHGARSWELRASRDLARLWRSRDRRVDARDLLASIYDRFTEGLDTADLREAKALLDGLA